ncbi:MAG: DUF2461 domain-containing protein [Acidobacteriaceae bacterium]|nr:DUF2461 domain-containing protein [Acidobacteriaceae bacterium]
MTASTKLKASPVKPNEFTGFPEQGFRFLRQLKLNNDRDWFRERKADYDQFVQRPMEALVLAAAAECRRRGLPLHAKERSPVMRVYRDIRFSKNKQPFKTHVAAEIRRDFVASCCMLYIHVAPEESFVAAGVWQPERPILRGWREAMVKQPARFEKMRRALTSKQLSLGGEHKLSTMPRGFQNYAQHPIGPWLKLTSFVTHRPLAPSLCTSPDLLPAVVDFAIAVKPLLEFGWHVEDSQKAVGTKKLREEDLW